MAGRALLRLSPSPLRPTRSRRAKTKSPGEAGAFMFQKLAAYANSRRNPPQDSSLGELVRVDHPSAGEAAHDLELALLRHCEAAFRAAEHAVLLDHLRFGIPGVVDD